MAGAKTMFREHGFVRTMSEVRVYAEYHVPSMLTPEFLASNAIVPQYWGYGESLRRMHEAWVTYQNGVSIFLTAAELQIKDNRSAFPEAVPECFDVAQRYLAAMQLVDFQSFVVTLELKKPMEDPGLFLTNRFLRPEFYTGEWAYMRVDPRFRFRLGVWDINMLMSPGLVTQVNGQIVQALTLSVESTAYKGEQGRGAIGAAVMQWANVQGTIEEIATELTQGG